MKLIFCIVKNSAPAPSSAQVKGRMSTFPKNRPCLSVGTSRLSRTGRDVVSFRNQIHNRIGGGFFVILLVLGRCLVVFQLFHDGRFWNFAVAAAGHHTTFQFLASISIATQGLLHPMMRAASCVDIMSEFLATLAASLSDRSFDTFTK